MSDGLAPKMDLDEIAISDYAHCGEGSAMDCNIKGAVIINQCQLGQLADRAVNPVSEALVDVRSHDCTTGVASLTQPSPQAPNYQSNWSPEEQGGFILGIFFYGEDFQSISKLVGTRQEHEVSTFFHGVFSTSKVFVDWKRARGEDISPQALQSQLLLGLARNLDERPGALTEAERGLMHNHLEAYQRGGLGEMDVFDRLLAVAGRDRMVELMDVGQFGAQLAQQDCSLAAGLAEQIGVKQELQAQLAGDGAATSHSQSTTAASLDGQKVCANCGTQNTPLWRKEAGMLMCNACGIYYKNHGFHRPVELIIAAQQQTGRQHVHTVRHLPQQPAAGSGLRSSRPCSPLHSTSMKPAQSGDPCSGDGSDWDLGSTEDGVARRSTRKRYAKHFGDEWCEPDEALRHGGVLPAAGVVSQEPSSNNSLGKRSRRSAPPSEVNTDYEYDEEVDAGGSMAVYCAEDHSTLRRTEADLDGYNSGDGARSGSDVPSPLRPNVVHRPTCSWPRNYDRPHSHERSRLAHNSATDEFAAAAAGAGPGSNWVDQHHSAQQLQACGNPAAMNVLEAHAAEHHQRHHADPYELARAADSSGTSCGTDLTADSTAGQVAAVLLSMKHLMDTAETEMDADVEDGEAQGGAPDYHSAPLPWQHQPYAESDGGEEDAFGLPPLVGLPTQPRSGRRSRPSGGSRSRAARWAQPSNKGPLQSCANCGTTKTPLWRKDKTTGETMCNACGIYKQTHGYSRPVEGFPEGVRRSASSGHPSPAPDPVSLPRVPTGRRSHAPSSNGSPAVAPGSSAPSSRAASPPRRQVSSFGRQGSGLVAALGQLEDSGPEANQASEERNPTSRHPAQPGSLSARQQQMKRNASLQSLHSMAAAAVQSAVNAATAQQQQQTVAQHPQRVPSPAAVLLLQAAALHGANNSHRTSPPPAQQDLSSPVSSPTGTGMQQAGAIDMGAVTAAATAALRAGAGPSPAHAVLLSAPGMLGSALQATFLPHQLQLAQAKAPEPQRHQALGLAGLYEQLGLQQQAQEQQQAQQAQQAAAAAALVSALQGKAEAMQAQQQQEAAVAAAGGLTAARFAELLQQHQQQQQQQWAVAAAAAAANSRHQQQQQAAHTLGVLQRMVAGYGADARQAQALAGVQWAPTSAHIQVAGQLVSPTDHGQPQQVLLVQQHPQQAKGSGGVTAAGLLQAAVNRYGLA